MAGLIGGLLATGFTSATLTVIFQRPEVLVQWIPLLIAAGISTIATIIAGWLPSFRLLHRRPLEIIRGE